MDTMRGALERAKMLVGMEVDEESALPPPEEQSFFDDINRHCTLNTTQASTDPSARPVSPRRSGGGSRFAALFLLRYRRGTSVQVAVESLGSRNAVPLSNHVLLTSFVCRGSMVSRYAWLPD
jgi:hypothetical protein